jgi:hypothetical protein
MTDPRPPPRSLDGPYYRGQSAFTSVLADVVREHLNLGLSIDCILFGVLLNE